MRASGPATSAPSLDTVVDHLRRARAVCVLTGAGVSAESGIPTFRGGDGLWDRYDPAELASEAGFRRDPRLVWEWYAFRQRAIASARPNAAHETIAAMERHYPRFTLVTQNVDGLHQRAGNAKVVELHGSIWRTRCTRDGTVAAISEPLTSVPPMCRCGALLRPDVTWFGEPLDRTALETAMSAASGADVLLVVGTSSAVYPAAALPGLTRKAGGKVIELNLEPTPLSAIADASRFGEAGTLLPSIWSRIENPKGL